MAVAVVALVTACSSARVAPDRESAMEIEALLNDSQMGLGWYEASESIRYISIVESAIPEDTLSIIKNIMRDDRTGIRLVEANISSADLNQAQLIVTKLVRDASAETSTDFSVGQTVVKRKGTIDIVLSVAASELIAEDLANLDQAELAGLDPELIIVTAF